MFRFLAGWFSVTSTLKSSGLPGPKIKRGIGKQRIGAKKYSVNRLSLFLVFYLITVNIYRNIIGDFLVIIKGGLCLHLVFHSFHTGPNICLSVYTMIHWPGIIVGLLVGPICHKPSPSLTYLYYFISHLTVVLNALQKTLYPDVKLWNCVRVWGSVVP